MTPIQEFINFIESLDSTIVEYPEIQKPANLDSWLVPNYKIDLKTLTKHIINYNSLQSWLQSKNLTDHLQKNIIKAILNTNPPESVRNELLSIML
jgi:hypothetical protein